MQGQGTIRVTESGDVWLSRGLEGYRVVELINHIGSSWGDVIVGVVLGEVSDREWCELWRGGMDVSR